LTIGAILAGTLVQFFVMRASRYVEMESILGLDAKCLDGVNQPWIHLVVPRVAPPCVDLKKSTAGVVLVEMAAICQTIVSLWTMNVACKTLFVKSDLYVFPEHYFM